MVNKVINKMRTPGVTPVALRAPSVTPGVHQNNKTGILIVVKEKK